MPDNVGPVCGQEVMPAEFRKNVDELMLRAVMRAQRAREYAIEWVVGSIVLVLIYVVTVAIPRSTFALVDVIVLVAAGFGGLVMVKFEWRRSESYKVLAQELLNEMERLDGKSK